MKNVVLIMALICLLSKDGKGAEQELMSLAEAAKQEGKDVLVTVEFVVKSWHAVLPDGRHVRLLAESSFRHKDAFVVHLTEDAVAKIGAEDVEGHFLGKTNRQGYAYDV
jgi:hypothetical protein